MAAKGKKANRDSSAKAVTKSAEGSAPAEKPGKMKNKEFQEHLKKLHGELVKLQLWVQQEGLRVEIGRAHV